MNNDSKTLWMSLGAGLFAAFLIYSYSQEKKAEFYKTYGAVQNVIVAKDNIAEMQTLDVTMLEVVQKPKDFIEPDAADNMDIVVGQVAAVPIKKGEQILGTKLLQPGPDTGIALQVAPSKRAVTLPVDEVRGVAKLIRPGDRVDIYAAIDSGKGVQQKREVMMIMQDVVILATGINVVNNIPRIFELDGASKNVNQISLSGDTKYSTLTLEASPKEAQDLIYLMAASPGNIYFTLRNPNDRTVPARIPSSSVDTILGRPVSSLEAPPTQILPTSFATPQAPPSQRR